MDKCLHLRAACALTIASLNAFSAEKEEAELPPGKVFKDCRDCPEMVVIPAGSFVMGSPAGETGRRSGEGPQHEVSIKSFALGTTEVTLGEFRRFARATGYKNDAGRNVGAKGCYSKDGLDGKWGWRAERYWEDTGFPQGDSHPAACISWNDAKEFVKWLSGVSSKSYRLPTEAEWEYAARGGSTTVRHWGNNPDEACRYANVADQTTHEGRNWPARHECADGHWFSAPVAGYSPNAFGLYDMIGNVWEWTEDCGNENYNGAPTDGSAWTSGICSVRVLRGGSWNGKPDYARAADRLRNVPSLRNYDFGFRLARSLP